MKKLLKEHWEKYYKNKSLASIVLVLLLYFFSKLCWPIVLSFISNFTVDKVHGLSEPEKEIRYLVSEADGKNFTGKNCRYLCDIASPETILGPLILQASPSEKKILKLYDQCYRKKHDALEKIKEIHDLEKDLRQTNTYNAALRFQKYTPKLDDFDMELQPEKAQQALQFLQTTSDNERAINKLIQDASIDILKYCEETIPDCSAIDSIYSKFKTYFNGYFADTNPKIFFEKKIQDCIQKCHDKQPTRFAMDFAPNPLPQRHSSTTPQTNPATSPAIGNKNTSNDKQPLQVIVRKNIDLTKTPNRFGDIIKHLNGGEIVTVLNENSPGWSLVRYENKEGYLPNDILMESGQ